VTKTAELKEVRKRPTVARLLIEHGTMIAFTILVIYFAFASPAFLTLNNISNIFMQSTMLAIIAFGLTLIVIVGSFDVSLASIVPVSGCLVAFLLSNGWSIPTAILVSLLPGIAVGAVNSFVILGLGVSDFIATLGMMSVLKGIVYMATEGRSIWRGIPDGFLVIGRGSVAGIPLPTLFMAVIFIMLWVMMTETKLGRRMVAVGGNVQAARLSGINVTGIKAFTFMLAGFLASIVGVVLTARLGSGQPAAGGSYFLDGIAATYLGASIFSKGQPHLLGTLIGVLIIGTMNNGLVLLGASYFVQDLIKGLVIIGAVALSTVGSGKNIARGL
jgi:ribose transport system permease protein